MKFKTKKKCETKSKAIEYQALKELRLELGMTLTDASANLFYQKKSSCLL